MRRLLPAFLLLLLAAPRAEEPVMELPEVVVQSRRFEEGRNRIAPSLGASVTEITREAIERLPQGEETPLNQVLLQAPGVVQAPQGELHVRGDHRNLQYRINGVTIPEATSGFGQLFDARGLRSVSLITGALPAQFGYRTAGVVDIRLRSGAQDPGGTASLYGGSFGTFQPGLSQAAAAGASSISCPAPCCAPTAVSRTRPPRAPCRATRRSSSAACSTPPMRWTTARASPSSRGAIRRASGCRCRRATRRPSPPSAAAASTGWTRAPGNGSPPPLGFWRCSTRTMRWTCRCPASSVAPPSPTCRTCWPTCWARASPRRWGGATRRSGCRATPLGAWRSGTCCAPASSCRATRRPTASPARCCRWTCRAGRWTRPSPSQSATG